MNTTCVTRDEPVLFQRYSPSVSPSIDLSVRLSQSYACYLTLWATLKYVSLWVPHLSVRPSISMFVSAFVCLSLHMSQFSILACVFILRRHYCQSASMVSFITAPATQNATKIAGNPAFSQGLLLPFKLRWGLSFLNVFHVHQQSPFSNYRHFVAKKKNRQINICLQISLSNHSPHKKHTSCRPSVMKFVWGQEVRAKNFILLDQLGVPRIMIQ